MTSGISKTLTRSNLKPPQLTDFFVWVEIKTPKKLSSLQTQTDVTPPCMPINSHWPHSKEHGVPFDFGCFLIKNSGEVEEAISWAPWSRCRAARSLTRWARVWGGASLSRAGRSAGGDSIGSRSASCFLVRSKNQSLIFRSKKRCLQRSNPTLSTFSFWFDLSLFLQKHLKRSKVFDGDKNR